MSKGSALGLLRERSARTRYPTWESEWYCPGIVMLLDRTPTVLLLLAIIAAVVGPALRSHTPPRGSFVIYGLIRWTDIAPGDPINVRRTHRNSECGGRFFYDLSSSWIPIVQWHDYIFGIDHCHIHKFNEFQPINHWIRSVSALQEIDFSRCSRLALRHFSAGRIA